VQFLLKSNRLECLSKVYTFTLVLSLWSGQSLSEHCRGLHDILDNGTQKNVHLLFLHALSKAAVQSHITEYLWNLWQGILKGEVSLYHWPPVWLVWNQLYDNRQFLFLFTKQTNPNQSNRSEIRIMRKAYPSWRLNGEVMLQFLNANSERKKSQPM